MPTFWGVGGTAIVSRTETALVTGTATVEATPTVYVSGTATVDRTSLAAWAAQTRRTATRVLMGDTAEDMVRIQGDVSVNVDGSSPVATAGFQLTDPRCAYAAADSIATGGIPVTIRCRISTETASADTPVFRGTTEAAPNEGAYVPRATIQCAGEGADWLEEKGCLNLAAFSEATRLEALKAFAESVDLDPDRITGGDGSATIYLSLDLSGLSTWALALRFAEMEDWYVRNVDGGLELLPARQVVGPAASPIFDFTPRNFFSVAETPPNRPITRYVLSAVGIPEEVLAGGSEELTAELQGGTDALGVRWETRIQTTTINGAMVYQRIEEWRDIAIPGTTPSEVSWRLWKLTETETDWGTVVVGGVTLRTARLDEQRTTVTEWYSPPCQTSDGYAWSDGTRHVAASATWQVTGTAVVTYTYDDAPSCLLTAKTTRQGGWYSPLSVGGHAYDGGAERLDTAYQWIPETYTPPYVLIEETYAEETSDTVSAVTSDIVTSGWRIPPGSAVQTEEWGEKSGSSTRWSTTPGSGVVTQATFEFFEDGSSAYNSKPYQGTLPVLQRAAADIPQYRTTPLVLTATADESRFEASPRAETVWGAETMADLVTVARRRFRDVHSPRVTILHRALPLLKLYDVVTVTDPTRELAEKVGYVESYRLNLNASTTGRLNQETTVCFPLPEFDPEVA